MQNFRNLSPSARFPPHRRYSYPTNTSGGDSCQPWTRPHQPSTGEWRAISGWDWGQLRNEYIYIKKKEKGRKHYSRESKSSSLLERDHLSSEEQFKKNDVIIISFKSWQWHGYSCAVQFLSVKQKWTMGYMSLIGTTIMMNQLPYWRFKFCRCKTGTACHYWYVHIFTANTDILKNQKTLYFYRYITVANLVYAATGIMMGDLLNNT